MDQLNEPLPKASQNFLNDTKKLGSITEIDDMLAVSRQQTVEVVRAYRKLMLTGKKRALMVTRAGRTLHKQMVKDVKCNCTTAMAPSFDHILDPCAISFNWR